MYILLLLYNVLYLIILLPLFIIASIFNKKIRLSLIGRITQIQAIKEFGRKFKNEKTLFFHSASVGEWEQSLPVIKEIKKEYPNIKIIASFFSPSGMHHAKTTDVDLSIYLPFDLYCIAYFFFKRINPTVWIISKYDVWPSFLIAAKHAHIPVILSSAELAADSNRHKGLTAKINRLFYKHIDYILPVSEEYKENFLQIYPYPERIIVSGDARYDQIIAKSEMILKQESIEIFTNNKEITIIAGSIWPADEKHLLPAIAKLYKEFNNIQVVLVPHELHESHIQAIETFFEEKSISTDRYSNFKSATTNAEIAIINTIGILAKLYKTSDIAYVGGGFSTGVHNVAEPAIFVNPVMYGPKHINSFEAVQLQKMKFCFSIIDEESCYKTLKKLIVEKQYRIDSGQKAKQFIYDNKGATNIIVSHIKKFL